MVALTGGKSEGRAAEAEKARSMADLAECLRTYDMLGLWRDAEEVLRREVVRGFIKKVIFSLHLHHALVPTDLIRNRQYTQAP